MKFKEDEVLQELKEFIDKSYTKHYSSSLKSTQTIDLIMELDDGAGFLKGNVIKYASRFGKKKDNPKEDLLKLMHYAILLYYFSFLKDEEVNEDKSCSNCGMREDISLNPNKRITDLTSPVFTKPGVSYNFEDIGDELCWIGQPEPAPELNDKKDLSKFMNYTIHSNKLVEEIYCPKLNLNEVVINNDISVVNSGNNTIEEIYAYQKK